MKEVIDHAQPILSGAVFTLAFVVALFFWRFYRVSQELLFGLFSIAFFLMACSWMAVAVLDPSTEDQPYFYLLRLVAFLLILGAIVHKNRPPGDGA